MTATQTLPTNVRHRYDFICLFDCKDGNYNGDPDAANQPRLDPETGEGLITDVCLKRKIRNFVQLTSSEEQRKSKGLDIFIKERAVLNELIERAYKDDEHVKQVLNEWKAHKAGKGKSSKKGEESKQAAPKPKEAVADAASKAMCNWYYDIRTFGAVLSTGSEKKSAEGDDDETAKIVMKAGQVRGPIQLTFARSVSPVLPLEHSITRCAVTNEKDLDKERTMGRKSTVPYGLFIAHGYFSPHLAHQTGLSESDLELFWSALTQMFEHDRSAARGQMATRQIVIFEHPLPKGVKDDQLSLGNAPAHKLFEAFEGYEAATSQNAKLPKEQRRLIRLADPALPPRGYEDYIVPTEAEVKARVSKFNVNVHYLL